MDDDDLELPPDLDVGPINAGGEGYFVPPTKGKDIISVPQVAVLYCVHLDIAQSVFTPQ